MKRILNNFILCLCAMGCIAFYSCSKKGAVKPAPTTTHPFDGYWYGSFTEPAGSGQQGMLFRSDGTLRVYDFYGQPPTASDTTAATAVANGTFKVVNVTTDSVSFTFASLNQTFIGTATFNPGYTQLTLAYTSSFGAAYTGGGTFNKQ